MSEPNRNVGSPLALIAIFAAITEASALASLPFLDANSQGIYTWFLVGFPPFLTLLFFITLNFNYKALYSPADFRDEDGFLQAIGSRQNPAPSAVSAPIQGPVQPLWETESGISRVHLDDLCDLFVLDGAALGSAPQATQAVEALIDDCLHRRSFKDISKHVILLLVDDRHPAIKSHLVKLFMDSTAMPNTNSSNNTMAILDVNKGTVSSFSN
ncbi:hypothetical protein [Pseudomonas sp. nanlin1]|uniref:hypothetical protein n=1 Tax=Pseudomonas sp. nanlin1 TaxID=3040605 RepID=UPI0038901C6C